jgi:hypothetical protein
MAIDNISYSKAVEAHNTAVVANQNGRPYKANTDYQTGDICVYNGQIYSCNMSYKSGASFDATKWTLLGGSEGGGGTASGTATDVTNFNGILSSIDTDVQKALETIDDNVANLDDKITILNSTKQDKGYVGDTQIDETARSNGRVLTYNSETGKAEYADVNVSGIVGSAEILQPSGSEITISQGEEIPIYHPAVSNDKMFVQVLEKVDGGTVVDNSIDFSDANKYVQQSPNGGTIFENGQVELDIYTKLLLHMNGTNGSKTFTDETGKMIDVIGSGMQLSTTQSKFGGSSLKSANSNASNYLRIQGGNDFNLGTSDFTIDFWFYANEEYLKIPIAFRGSSTNSLVFDFNDGYGLWLYFNSSGGTVLYKGGAIGAYTNGWHHYTVTRKNNMLYFFIDGTLINSVSYNGSFNFDIGLDIFYIDSTNDYLDELRISKGIARWTSNFTPPSSQYDYLSSAKYISTFNNSFSLTTIDKLNAINITQNTPTNTNIKYLISFDNKTNWLYHDTEGWHIYTDDLSVDWINSNTKAEIETYFTNKPVADIVTDLSALGITPIAIDFAIQLSTTDTTVTPSIDLISITADNKPYMQVVSIGKFGDVNVDYNIKRISDSQTNVRKASEGSANIIVNTVIGV